MDTKPVTGAPYSATAITTVSQTLSDGTHITRTIQAQLARDSAGRTRREENMSAVGPWSTGGAEQRMVSITDPVAQTHFMLRPDQQVAMKAPLPPGEGPGIPGPGIAGMRVHHVVDDAHIKMGTGPDNVAFVAKEGAVMIIGGLDKKAQVEELGG